MNNSILKYAGGAGLPFVLYTPVTVNDAPSASLLGSDSDEKTKKSKSDDDSKGKMTEKDVLGLLNGVIALPSDMQEVRNELMQFFQLRNLGIDIGIDTADLATQYISAVSKIQDAKYHYEVFTKAYNNLISKDGLDEVAITNQGDLLVTTENSKTPISVSLQEYNKNKDKYHPLTNQELLMLRAHSAPGADAYTAIAANGIGMSQVNTLINDLINNIGTTETGSDLYVDTRLLQGKEVLKQLRLALLDNPNMDLAGFYKAGKITKTLAALVLFLFDYVTKMLPKKAYTLLSMKSNMHPELLILDNLLGRLDYSSKLSLDMLEDENGHKPGTKESGDGGKGDDMNTAALFAMGFGNKINYTIQDGTMNGFSVKATLLPITDGNSPLGTNITIDLLSNSLYSGLLDFTNVSIGGKVIDSNAFNKTLISDGKILSVELPVDLQLAAMGNIVPDYDALRRKDQADSQLRNSGIDIRDQKQIILNYAKINEVYRQYNLPAAYTEKGELITTNYLRFAVFNGVAIGSAFLEDDLEDNKRVIEITNDKSIDNITDLIRKANGWKSDNNEHYDFFDKKSMWDTISPIWNGHDSYYKGTIFIPMNSNYMSAQAGTGLKIKQPFAQEIERKLLLSDKRRLLMSIYRNPNNI